MLQTPAMVRSPVRVPVPAAATDAAGGRGHGRDFPLHIGGGAVQASQRPC